MIQQNYYNSKVISITKTANFTRHALLNNFTKQLHKLTKPTFSFSYSLSLSNFY